MKALLFTDTHIGEKKYSSIEEEFKAYDFLFDQIIEAIKVNSVDMVIFLGDLVHSVNNLELYQIIYLKSKLEEINKYAYLFILSGNHDQHNSNKYNQINALFSSKNTKSIQTIYHHYFSALNISFIFISYMQNKELIEVVEKINNSSLLSSSTNFLFGHFAVFPKTSLQFSLYNAIDYDLLSNFFDKFKYVYLGHIHSVISFKNVIYLGSVVNHNFLDAVSYSNGEFFSPQRYMYILDIDDNAKLTPIEMKTYDNFLIINDSDYRNDSKYFESLKAFILSHNNIYARLNVTSVDNYADIVSELKKFSTIKSVKIETKLNKEQILTEYTAKNISEITSIDLNKFISQYISDDISITSKELKSKIIESFDSIYSQLWWEG